MFLTRSRRIKWIRTPVLLLLIIGGLGALAWLDARIGPTSERVNPSAESAAMSEPAAPAIKQVDNENWAEQVLAEPNRQVLFRTRYVSGEVEEERKTMASAEIVQFRDANQEWSSLLTAEGTVIFEKKVNDVSPIVKQNGYFGLDDNGVLTLFNGPPSRENVIRTFFQIDVGHLESSLPKDLLDDLHNGIRVSDAAEYNSVISTFSDFGVGRKSVNVIKPE